MRVGRGAVVLAAALGAAIACGGGGDGASKKDTPRATAVQRDTATQATRGAGRRTVLFLGTSLTAGLGLEPDSAYPALVQRKIDSAGLAFRVVNAGVSGETSAGLLRRLDWVLQQPAAVIVVETGANDGLRGLPVASTRATIGEILARIRAARPEATIVLAQMEAPPNLGASYTGAFHAMFPALAAEHGAVLMPFLLRRVAGQPALNQADGVHPNDAGEKLVAEDVWEVIRKELLRR